MYIIADCTVVYAFIFEGDKVELQRLDCSSSPPTLTHTIKIKPNVHVSGPQGMCCVKEGRKTSIVTGQLLTGLTAYDTQTGEVKWTIAGCLEDGKICPKLCPPKGALTLTDRNVFNLTAITTDGQGHIFASDLFNKCIHMFSSSSGEYMGNLSVKGRCLNNSESRRMQWCEKTAALIVSFKEGDSTKIAWVSVQ